MQRKYKIFNWSLTLLYLSTLLRSQLYLYDSVADVNPDWASRIRIWNDLDLLQYRSAIFVRRMYSSLAHWWLQSSPWPWPSWSPAGNQAVFPNLGPCFYIFPAQNGVSCKYLLCRIGMWHPCQIQVHLNLRYSIFFNPHKNGPFGAPM